MFGVDFSELMVILVVALVVIGPERLPKVARTLGHLLGRAHRYINSVKADISHDMAIDEMRQLQQQVQQQAAGAGQAASGIEQMARQGAQIFDQQAPHVMAEEARHEPQLTPEQKKFPID